MTLRILKPPHPIPSLILKSSEIWDTYLQQKRNNVSVLVHLIVFLFILYTLFKS